MEQSILKRTKKILQIDPADTAFDLDVITHINAAFSTLTQLGIGPDEGFFIEDESSEWGEFESDTLALGMIPSYVGLFVKRIFDPPTTSYTQVAMDQQIAQFEWRLSTNREATQWTDPDPPEVVA